jgi:hypothetical protein|tara:strand:- start:6504 stop:8219 length:1716 start_codon:yes stop_codon:yes gene_type:complete
MIFAEVTKTTFFEPVFYTLPMVDRDALAIRWQELTSSRIFLPLLFVTGLIASVTEPVFRSILGYDVSDAIWPYAYRMLQWTMFLRENVVMFTFSMSVLLFLTFIVLQRQLGGKENPLWLRSMGCFTLGFLGGLIAMFFALDAYYLRGAFLLLPTAFGFALFSLLLVVGGFPHIPRDSKPLAIAQHSMHIMGVFFAAWLVMPGIPAMAGFAPSPPPAPILGYGAEPGPFETSLSVHPYELPSEVEDILDDTEKDLEFSIYLTLPILPDDVQLDSIPLAILTHGWGYPIYEEYTDWIAHLSAKGMAVAFIQYPSDISPEIPEGFEAVDEEGASNWPHHIYRALAFNAAFDEIESSVLGLNRSAEVDEILGEMVVDPSHLWVGGHSLGGAYVFLSLYESMERSWGNQTLFLDFESAWTRPNHPELQPNMSRLPNTTMVHLAQGIDDMSVDACYSVHHQVMFSQLPQEHVLFIELQSDLYGFPRLVGTHYLQTDSVHDTLADWGFYRRIDAQADWVVARSRGDVITESWAYEHLLNSPLLTEMGEWSDGEPVLPLLVHHEALTMSEKFKRCQSKF